MMYRFSNSDYRDASHCFSYGLAKDKTSDINWLDIMLIPFGIGLIMIPAKIYMQYKERKESHMSVDELYEKRLKQY